MCWMCNATSSNSPLSNERKGYILFLKAENERLSYARSKIVAETADYAMRAAILDTYTDFLVKYGLNAEQAKEDLNKEDEDRGIQSKALLREIERCVCETEEAEKDFKSKLASTN